MNTMKNMLWGIVLIILGLILGLNALDITNIDMNYIEIHTNPELDFIKNSEKGQPFGVAELGEDGKVLKSQLPDGILSAKMSVYYNGGDT